ncbi:hypothetical protein DFH09DRAFT_1103808 [Mycena vulgaris]|nr:hypothetical protein DFH09DRAFT_1103808 [Mycena vulgaris]
MAALAQELIDAFIDELGPKHGLPKALILLDRVVPLSVSRHALLSRKELSLFNISIYSEEAVLPSFNVRDFITTIPTATIERLALEYWPDKSVASHALLLGGGLANPLRNIRHLELSLFSGQSLEDLVIDFWSFNPPAHPPSSSLPDFEGLLAHTASRKSAGGFLLREEIDSALESLPRLREVHFGVSCPKAVVEFEPYVRKTLPLASDTGLLTFSTTSQPEEYDNLMRHFSH